MKILKLVFIILIFALGHQIIAQENESIFEEIIGIANDSRIRIRKEPNLDSENLGYLDKDQVVIILDKTDEAMQIGSMNSVWYFIRTESGIEGWSYGFFIDPDYESVNEVLMLYYYDELPRLEDDIYTVIQSHSEIKGRWKNIKSSTYTKNEGTPVLAKNSGKIIAIGWFKNDSSKSMLLGIDGESVEIQGIGFGYYILMHSGSDYYIYAHLKPDAESTLSYLKLLNNKPDSDGLLIKPGMQIGEFGSTGTSNEPNFQYVKFTLDN